MSGFWKNEGRRLESELRSARPEASNELVRGLSRRIEARRPTGVPRLALAGAMTALMLVALGSVGGISYAANAAKGALVAVKQAVAPTGAVEVTGLNAGGDQYKPGYGYGDKNHNHTGPPGLKRKGGEAAPPIRAQSAGKAKTVSFTVTLDEQSALWISVLGDGGKRLLLTQKGARVGSGIGGRQTKSIHYVVLVPRALPIKLRIPANLLTEGKTYSIRVLARDPNGNKTTLEIPFIA